MFANSLISGCSRATYRDRCIAEKERLTYTAGTSPSCSYGIQVRPNNVLKWHNLVIAVSI